VWPAEEKEEVMSKKIMWPDASLDCETLGLGVNPAIVSIGVQLFDRVSGKLGPTFYHEIDLFTALKSGGVTGSTLSWWLKQGPNALRIFSKEPEVLKNKLPLATALHALINFLRESASGDVRVWANGPCADVTWLESAFDKGAVGLAPPWSYKNVRCYRTLVDAAEAVGFNINNVMFTGTRHNALADATYQAHVMMLAWRVLTKGAANGAVAPKLTAPVEEDDEL
jgi:3' exoribonuclease, RNase T-like